MKKPKNFVIGLNLLLLILFILLLIYLSIKFAPYVAALIKKPDRFRDLLVAYGPISIPVFISLQIMQVVIAAIPGELVHISGGYVYGTTFGAIYSAAGIFLGALIAFYISRLLGFTLVKKFVSPDTLEKFTFLINSPKSELTMFLLFIIPGIPKDVLVYIAGLTPINPKQFFLIYLIARLPGILVSSYIGANIREKDYLPVIVIAVVAGILLIIGLIKKDVIINKLSRLPHLKPQEQKK
jgi:uncharacterized membrane protein YdjX (TVP38/TMEM64 family)